MLYDPPVLIEQLGSLKPSFHMPTKAMRLLCPFARVLLTNSQDLSLPHDELLEKGRL